MAEKNLEMTFSTADGDTTTMTLSGVKQNLDGTTVKNAMNGMVASGAFATSKGEPYTGVVSARYVETVETELFDNTDEEA